MSADTRLKMGLALLLIGLVMPAGTVFVANTTWPLWVKTLVSGTLFFGLEIVTVPAIALMGKENFDRIVNWTKARLRTLKPVAKVGRTRYATGLVLFVVPILSAWIASYLPLLLPADSAFRLWLNLLLDLMLVSSLFVLGGEFWDKLRALFFYDARVIIHPNLPTPQI